MSFGVFERGGGGRPVVGFQVGSKIVLCLFPANNGRASKKGKVWENSLTGEIRALNVH